MFDNVEQAIDAIAALQEDVRLRRRVTEVDSDRSVFHFAKAPNSPTSQKIAQRQQEPKSMSLPMSELPIWCPVRGEIRAGE